MTSWIEDLFGVSKPVIGMCHLHALPGDPAYDDSKGLSYIVDEARKDLLALQDGGVDAVMFSNEFSLPYLTKVDTITVVSMARVITELKPDIRITYGVNVLWDPIASLDLAKAVDGKFVREVFTGVYAGDFGLWDTNCGATIRHQRQIDAQSVRLLFNIVPEAASYLAQRDMGEIARSTVFNTQPDGLCVSGLTAGSASDAQTLQVIKNAVPDTPVFANTGVRLENVEEQLRIADGAVVGTTFKENGFTWNPVQADRVKALMEKVHSLRAAVAA